MEKDIQVEVNSRLRVSRVAKDKRFLKVLPMLMAGLFLLNTVLSYYDIEFNIISYLAGVGLLPLVYLFRASYMFGFCAYHRMFLWYIVANDIVSWIDYNFNIPLSDKNYLVLHFIIAGIFLFIILWMKRRCDQCK